MVLLVLLLVVLLLLLVLLVVLLPLLLVPLALLPTAGGACSHAAYTPSPAHSSLIAATARGKIDLRAAKRDLPICPFSSVTQRCYVRVFSRVRTITLEGTAQVKRHG